MPIRRTITRAPGGKGRLIFEENEEWLNLFSARERNALLRAIWSRVINEWRYIFLKRRIEKMTVLRPPFSYRGDPHTPMIDRGLLAKKAVWQGKITVRAKKAKDGIQELSGTIGLPFGHPVSREISRVFAILPADEMEWMADRFGKLLVDERARAQDTTSNRKNARPRMALSPEQRRRFRVRPRRRRGAVR